MHLTSTAFRNTETIPVKYTADGRDISPPLAWVGAPPETQELALVMDDPDAPRGTWVHWVIWAIPADAEGLPEAIARTAQAPSVGAIQGVGSSGKVGYYGPAPPRGSAHHYNFTLYALDVRLGLRAGVTKEDLLQAMEGHILTQDTLTGIYGRGG